MGADYAGQEDALAELAGLSNGAKEYLNHHIMNTLTGILGASKLGRHDMVEQGVWHIVDDFEKAGIRPKLSRRW
ncbi:MAG: hypothetical protein M0024_01500 [Nitrospiraceae bacterium]|nr:hypothetical protein [Nitrospiraceae bacterium]